MQAAKWKFGVSRSFLLNKNLCVKDKHYFYSISFQVSTGSSSIKQNKQKIQQSHKFYHGTTLTYIQLVFIVLRFACYLSGELNKHDVKLTFFN